MYMPWLPDYTLGVKEIDTQHKEFVRIINDLNDAIEIGSADIVLGDILAELSNYANYHFATEEKYFDQFHYELTQEHKQQHNEIRDDLESFMGKYQTDATKYSQELLVFVKNWFEEHTQGHDRKYIHCFHANGLE